MQGNQKKVLYIANVASHIVAFHLPYLKWFKKEGYEVHVAINGDEEVAYADKVWNVPFGRSITSTSNIHAYKKLRDICLEHNYELIHCHTPIAAGITRLAAVAARRNGAKVLYTSHGFNFYENASLIRWLTFLPAEWILSFLTDGIITINKEDFEYLNKYRFKSEGKHKIDGIGLDPDRLEVKSDVDKDSLKSQFGYNDNHVLVLYIAEFIERKNHRFIINNVPDLVRENPNVRFLFAGRGVLMDEMKQRTRTLRIEDHISFLGFRKDIGKIIKMCDIGISSSRYEGLGLGVAEMMFNELPVVISNDRGHRELVAHGQNGFIFKQQNSEEFKTYLNRLCQDEELRNRLGEHAKKSMNRFVIDNSLEQMKEIYRQYL